MTRAMTGRATALSRREFLAATGGALAGVAAFGPGRQAKAARRHSQRGGTLKFAMRADSQALDPHRHIINLVSHPLAATTQGLVDLNQRSEPVPGIAEEWNVSKDLQIYTFKLRQGVLYHNGREVDAESVKWNLERILDPKIGHAFHRSALDNLAEVTAPDKYTVRCMLKEPSAAFPADVMYYPVNLIAPDSAGQVDILPIGCGPFKFVKWDRFNLTLVERFENYFETDAEGNTLPYLDALEGRPKREEHIRLAALRAGEVQLIDTMAYADAATFPRQYAGQFQTWDVPALGTAFVTFNTESGPFKDKILRQAAAHAIDHEAIHQAVFYGRGEIARSFFAPVSPWYPKEIRSWPAYDPEKARFLIKKARAEGTTVLLQADSSWPYMQQTGDLVQAMWTEAGFKVQLNIYDTPVLHEKRRTGEFHADAQAGSYRWDPDSFFSRQVLSTAASTRELSRFQNERADKLILEARATADKQKRLELYAEIDSIINEELPMLYTHHLTLLAAGVLNLKGYQPAISGAYSYQGGGIRTAWLE